MKKLIIFLSFLISTTVFAQNNCWVILKDKDGVVYDGSLENPDFYDLPLRVDYTSSIKAAAKKVLGESRWLNAVAVKANKHQIEHILKMEGVESVVSCNYEGLIKNSKNESVTGSNHALRSLAQHQTARLGASLFHDIGLTGKGIKIAVFDGGFPGVNTHKAFEHLRPNIIATYDFTKDNTYVWRGNSHGTSVLSNIGGKMDDIPLGLAVDAEYLLAITEVSGEPFSEEISWLLAMEWAYEHGAQIISSSLGYHRDRYFQEDMDGQTSFVARAAAIAARKGMLVINAAGNEGDSKWKMIITPADADSVLCIGGIDPKNEIHIGFSSFGPSADGRLKPNVCANGRTVTAVPNGGYTENYGTSFATPLIAGFAACAWQANPEKNNIEIYQAIQESGELYPYFDYAHGYGVPHASYFTKKVDKTPSFDIEEDEDWIYVQIKDECLDFLGRSNIFRLYYHIEGDKKILSEYSVINVFQKEALRLPKARLTDKKFLRVHFLGYTETYELN